MNRWMKIFMVVLSLAGMPVLAMAAATPAPDSKQTPPATQADQVKSGQDQEQLEKELEQARQVLQDAAQRVARLSMQLNEPDMRDLVRIGSGGRHFKHGAVLGISLDNEDSDTGVSVGGVTPGGPADKAGLRTDDIITGINGTAFKGTDDASADEQLMKFMDGVKPGDSLKLAYTRDGKPATAMLVAGDIKDYRHSFGYNFEMPPVPPMPPMPPMTPRLPRLADRGFGFYFDSDRPWGEMQLVPLTADLGQYFGTDKGLLVVRAAKDSKLQLKDGDVITAIGGRDPGSPSHAMRILGSYGPGESIKLDIMRKGKPVNLSISVPPSKDDDSVTGVFSLSGPDADDDDDDDEAQ